MPRCNQCGFQGDPSEFDPCLSPYHDLRCPKCGTTNIDTSDQGEEYGYGKSNFLRPEGMFEEAKKYAPKVEVLMQTIREGIIHRLPESSLSEIFQGIEGAVRAFYQQIQIDLEKRAINIILHQEGPDMKFIEIENDKGAGVGVGEYLEQKGKYSKLRITAADIINLEDVK